MRKIDQSDFETANVEYIEFWLLDPYLYEAQEGVTAKGGDLYFNLGEVSEDVLKDGKKLYRSSKVRSMPSTILPEHVQDKMSALMVYRRKKNGSILPTRSLSAN